MTFYFISNAQVDSTKVDSTKTILKENKERSEKNE